MPNEPEICRSSGIARPVTSRMTCRAGRGRASGVVAAAAQPGSGACDEHRTHPSGAGIRTNPRSAGTLGRPRSMTGPAIAARGAVQGGRAGDAERTRAARHANEPERRWHPNQPETRRHGGAITASPNEPETRRSPGLFQPAPTPANPARRRNDGRAPGSRHLENPRVVAIFRVTQTSDGFASLADHLEQLRRRRRRDGERALTAVRAGCPPCSVGRPLAAGQASDPIRE
jgi:hypothetical protein